MRPYKHIVGAQRLRPPLRPPHTASPLQQTQWIQYQHQLNSGLLTQWGQQEPLTAAQVLRGE